MNKTILLTGGNSGIGLHTVLRLLEFGYSLIITVRDEDKGTKAISWLQEKKPSAPVSFEIMDLADIESIQALVKRLDTPFFGLVCNAGVQHYTGFHQTKDGFEAAFGVNHLGHYLLTRLLLEKYSTIKRIAVVTSGLHREGGAGPIPGPEYQEPELLAHPQVKATSSKAGGVRYATSKLCNVYFTYELAERLQNQGRNDILVNCLVPGLIPETDLARNSTTFVRFLWNYFLPIVAKFVKDGQTAKQASTNLAYLIHEVSESAKCFEGPDDMKPTTSAYDKERMVKLWEESARLLDMEPELKLAQE